MDFSEVARRQLDGETLRLARLVEFRWKSGTDRLWTGEWPLTTLDGRVWKPTQGHGQITGLSQTYDGQAPEIKFTLSGVDGGTVAKLVGAESEYYGRLALIYWQFFDAGWNPVGPTVPITWGLMRNFVGSMKSVEDGFLHTITLTAETPFSGRARPKFSYITDTDQKARHPRPRPDRMCERVAGLETRSIQFPQF